MISVLYITIKVDAPTGQAIGIKEDIATYLERFGDAQVVDIREEKPEQMKLEVRTSEEVPV